MIPDNNIQLTTIISIELAKILLQYLRNRPNTLNKPMNHENDSRVKIKSAGNTCTLLIIFKKKHQT